MRGHGADEVAPGEGGLPGGEPVRAEDVHRALHVEAARLQRTGLTTEHRLHRLAVKPDARGTLMPSGEEILGGRDLVLALAGVERGHLASGARGHVIRGRRGVDLEGPARELAPLGIGDADDGEAALAVDHSGDAQLADETVAPFRLCDRAGRRGVLVQRLTVQLAPAPVGPLHPVGTVMCVCSCGSTVTVPVAGSVTGRAVRWTNSGMTSLARTASVVLVSGLYWRAQPALAWRYSAAACTPRRGCAGWWTVCARRRARRGCSRPWVLTRSRRRRRPSVSASVCRAPHPCVDVCRPAPRRSRCRSPRRADPTLPHRARSTSRQLTASGVVLELLLRYRLAQIPHRLLDAGELADRDHRGNTSCTSFSVGRERLQSAYFFGTFDLEEISDATVCDLGSSMPVREVVKAVTRGVMQVRLSEVKGRWPVAGRPRDDVREARGDPKTPPHTIRRLGSPYGRGCEHRGPNWRILTCKVPSTARADATYVCIARCAQTTRRERIARRARTSRGALDARRRESATCVGCATRANLAECAERAFARESDVRRNRDVRGVRAIRSIRMTRGRREGC